MSMSMPWSEPQLEAALADLAAAIELPSPPDIAGRVRARLEAAPAARRRTPVEVMWEALRRPALAATALVVLISVAMMASPDARVAVARWLGLQEVRIKFQPLPVPTPTSAPRELGDDAGLLLGDRVTMRAAERIAGFDVLTPRRAGLGNPDEIYVRTFGPRHQVALLYDAAPGSPEITLDGLGYLVTQFNSDLSDEGYFLKASPEGSQVREVSVADERGFWLTGPDHYIVYHSSSGEYVDDSVRLVSRALIFQRGNVVYRIETRGSLADAVSLAESMFQ